MKNNDQKPNIGIIAGSNRPGRICLSITEWITTEMQREDLNLTIIDLAEITLPFLDEPDLPARHNYKNEHTKHWSETINGFDGFVLVFPQYNWGYPAVLKNALDYLYDEWAGKPVSIMSYGGHGGFQAALGMRLVTQGLAMYNMATNPSFHLTKEMFDEQGQIKALTQVLSPYRQSIQAVSAEFSDLLIHNTTFHSASSHT